MTKEVNNDLKFNELKESFSFFEITGYLHHENLSSNVLKFYLDQKKSTDSVIQS
jgi:hypothetical protein